MDIGSGQARCGDTGALSASPDRYPRSGTGLFGGGIPRAMRCARWRRSTQTGRDAAAGRRHRIVFSCLAIRACPICPRPMRSCARSLAQEAQRTWLAGAACAPARTRSRAAARIRPNDAQRIQRALEVIALTGKPLSAQQGGAIAALWLSRAQARVSCRRIARSCMRASPSAWMPCWRRDFSTKCAPCARAATCMADLPAMRAVGYRQAWQHLDGEFDAAQFRERAIFATRQLAKRQMTWLRAELDARALDPLVRRLSGSGGTVRLSGVFSARLVSAGARNTFCTWRKRVQFQSLESGAEAMASCWRAFFSRFAIVAISQGEQQCPKASHCKIRF